MAFLAVAVTTATTAITNALTAIGIGATAAGTIASSVVQFGISTLIGAVFTKKPRAEDVGRDLAQQTTAPAYRFVYGEARATGTPAGIPVLGKYIYGAWILNSRPSDLSDFVLYLDKREVLLTGNAFNFSGSGAIATEDPFAGHVNVWISRGDQTSPPSAFRSEAPWSSGAADHLWKSTDDWRGLTVIWLKLDAGEAGERQERWPASPPLVEVEGKFSKVYDPRDNGQDHDDPDTWEWSENHALCVRDALRQNPIRSYSEDLLHETFEDGADVCDETVSLKSGGTERRYRVAGTVVFSEGEIEDQVNPLVTSGCAQLIRVGGQLGYAAGEYRLPEETLSYFLGSSIEFPDLLPGDQLANEIRASYLSPARGYETAELLPWSIPGALAEDGGAPSVATLDLPFCPSATQAMRVRKIFGLRQRRQERISGGQLPPEAFDLIAGSTVNIALPSPYDALDGVYEIETIHPGFDPVGESGELALRMPAVLVKHDSSIYSWVPAADEEDVYDEVYNATRASVALPGVISASSGPGVDLDTGASFIPRFRFEWAPSASDSSLHYEWEWRLSGDNWQSGGVVDAEIRDAGGDVFVHLPVAGVSHGHDFRVRTVSEGGRSGWRSITGVFYNMAIGGLAGASGLGHATFTGNAPSNDLFKGFRVFSGAVGSSFGDASQVMGLTEVAPGAPFSIVAGDDGAANIISNGSFGSSSGWTLEDGWSVSGGKARHAPTASGSSILRSASMTAGQRYRWSITVSEFAVPNGRIRIVGSSTAQSVTFGGEGFEFGELVAPSAPSEIGINSYSVGDFAVDNFAAYADGPGFLDQGTADFWVVPVTITGSNGQPSSPITLTVK